MGFLHIAKAIYDYSPQGESELEIKEGDILYILDDSGGDGWWKAKKKASAEDDDEPVGLIPQNYVEEAKPKGHARALFDYNRQTDEELSFTEDARLEVFDTSDPDWILVGLENEYGFAPANYIELAEEQPPLPTRRPISTVEEVPSDPESEPASPPAQSPAAVMANAMRSRPAPASVTPSALLPRPQYTPEASDEEEPSPALPARPASIPAQPRQRRRESEVASPTSPGAGIVASPPYNRASGNGAGSNLAASGYHLYNINEMISVMGKRKKMPTTLGINLATGTIMIAPEKELDGPQQEWTAEKMKSYNLEGKHVFIELFRPSKSIEFHAGAKDTAQEIIQALGDLSGAVRAEGLREVLQAGSGQNQKKGKVLYDFMAQGDDEVTVAVDDEVIILDDSKSDEWWQVHRLKNGKEGVVPSSYIEIMGVISVPSSMAGINAGRPRIEKNRKEEERLAREAIKSSEVGPGMKLPERNSSRRPDNSSSRSSKSKPDSAKVRTWTDRSKSFSVDAQFLTLKEGKIHLHKVNGVKIAVPVSKMSIEDLNYVERMTGVSLDEDKPLSEIKKLNQSRTAPSSPIGAAGAIIEQPKKAEYDWFQFFLSCDIAVGLCNRYSDIFNRGSMDQSVLPDVDAVVLRNLGIREGDIIKIIRHLDATFNRKKKVASEDAEGSGGLFSGPGGALRNNTRKGRPAPAVQTNDVVDPAAFSREKGGESRKPFDAVSTPLASAPTPTKKDVARGGFDDDAWDVKPAKDQPSTPVLSAAPTPPQPSQAAQQVDRPPSAPSAQTLTGAMQDLSLLAKPLEPTKLQPQPTPVQFQQALQQQPQQQAPQHQAPHPTGANPSFFTGLSQQQTGVQPQAQQFGVQQHTFNPQQMPQNIARQRPMAPQVTQNSNSLVPPPPPRPLSAPQAPQQSAFGPPPPLQAQMTGLPNSGGFQSSLAAPGTSLGEMNQMRMQQQYQQQQQQMQLQQTGFSTMQSGGMMHQPTSFGQFNNAGMQQQQMPNGFGQQAQPQQTGFGQQPQFINGNQPQNSPFADPSGRQSQFSNLQPQPAGFQSSFSQQQNPQATGINAFLPAPLQPQPTGAIISAFGSTSGFGQPPPVPPMRQSQQGFITAPTPLVPQPTGPPPPVRFGLNNDAKKLAPQPTGKRANLAAATPQNPFGF